MTSAYSRQKGAVLLLVVLVAAFIIIVLTQSTKTVRYQKQLTTNLWHKQQAQEYLLGLESLALIWLQRAFEKEQDKNRVHLGQAWAQEPITFPIEGGAMTASVRDRQNCFNLNSIVYVEPEQNNEQAAAGRSLGALTEVNTNTAPAPIDAASTTDGQEILSRLISQVVDDDVKPDAIAAAVRDWIDEDIEPAGADGVEDDYYQGLEPPYLTANTLIADVSELRAIKGINRRIFDRLLPYVCVLPDHRVAKLNVNTLEVEHAELLWATLGGKVSMEEVKRILNERPEEGFDEDLFWQLVGQRKRIKKSLQERIGVSSDYFELNAEAQLGNSRLLMRSLLKRDGSEFQVVARYFGRS